LKYSDFDNRKFARHTDVDPPVTATIEDMCPEEDQVTKKKQLVVYFPEDQFRFAVGLNKTRREALAEITGSDDPMDAIGVIVELFNDITIRNPRTGEVGSIGIRRPGSGKKSPGEAIDFEKKKRKGEKK